MIGLFDSGSGGLSVLSAIRAVMPNADIVYFGDIKNAPYGIRSQSELTALTVAGIDMLRERGAQAIVSACNSVSQHVLNGAAGDLPFVEMSEPTAAHMKQHQDARVLLIATPATIDSGMYAKALDGIVVLDSLSISELAGAIEFGRSDDEIKRLVRTALAVRSGSAYDCMILGCTHYPLVRNIIEEEARSLFGEIAVVDPAIPVAHVVGQKFSPHGRGHSLFVISEESSEFRRRVAELFPQGQYTIEVL